MSNSPTSLHQSMINGLVGSHEALYHNSPEFKQAIQTLALLLAPMVQGLADQARTMMDQRLFATERLLTQTSFEVRIDPEIFGFPIPKEEPNENPS